MAEDYRWATRIELSMSNFLKKVEKFHRNWHFQNWATPRHPSDIVRRNAQLAALFNFQSPNVSYWFKTCLLSQIALYVHLHNGLIFEKKFNLEKPHYFPQSP